MNKKQQELKFTDEELAVFRLGAQLRSPVSIAETLNISAIRVLVLKKSIIEKTGFYNIPNALYHAFVKYFPEEFEEIIAENRRKSGFIK